MAMNAASTISNSWCSTVRAANPTVNANSAPIVQVKPCRSGERRELGCAGTPNGCSSLTCAATPGALLQQQHIGLRSQGVRLLLRASGPRPPHPAVGLLTGQLSAGAASIVVHPVVAGGGGFCQPGFLLLSAGRHQSLTLTSEATNKPQAAASPCYPYTVVPEPVGRPAFGWSGPAAGGVAPVPGVQAR